MIPVVNIRWHKKLPHIWFRCNQGKRQISQKRAFIYFNGTQRITLNQWLRNTRKAIKITRQIETEIQTNMADCVQTSATNTNSNWIPHAPGYQTYQHVQPIHTAYPLLNHYHGDPDATLEHQILEISKH